MLKRIDEMIENYIILRDESDPDSDRIYIYLDILSDLEELKKLRQEEVKIN